MDPTRLKSLLSRPRVRVALVALLVMMGTTFAMAWNPPTAKVHSFTRASDYDQEKESGCTNSGEGCHGSERTYADFNEYHPDATCTTCHEYQGVGCIPCHTPGRERECALCHDGSKEGISDRVRITDPYPRGHYRETSHTAMGTVMDAEVRAAEGGKAAATCEDCHSDDLRTSHTNVPMVDGSPYGESVGCGECHNDVRTRGMAEVLADWKGRRCEDCHAVGTSSVMHDPKIANAVVAEDGESCGESGSGCHQGNDLHALHPDQPATCSGSAEEGEPGCHDLEVESHAPTATGCGRDVEGACHPAYRNGALSHAKDDEQHSPSTRGPASDASAFGIPCGDCHLMEPDGTSLVDEHALPTSEKTLVPGDVCRDCHNDPASAEAIADEWETRDSSSSCDACHGSGELDAVHSSDVGDVADVHDAADGSEGCAESGPGCHPSGDLAEVGTPTTTENIHATCLRCHDARRRDGNRAYDPDADTCGTGRDCHSEYDPANPVHADADSRDKTHSAGRAQARATFADPLTGLEIGCAKCHSMTLGTEHSRPGSSLAAEEDLCSACHNAADASSEAVKASWPRKASSSACATCHGAGAGDEPHAGVTTAHQAVERSIDGAVKPGACVRSGCHGSLDLRELHKGYGCTVMGCHSSSGDIRGRGLVTCGGIDSTTGCHTGYSGKAGHGQLDAAHAAAERTTDGVLSKGACAKSGCHPSTDARKLHRGVGCGIPGCHSAEGPSVMSCGGSASTVSCHPGFSIGQHFVDHSADMTGTVGGVEYGPGANEGCFGCHETSLSIEHARERNAGSMDGASASGCRVCHYNAADAGSGAYGSLARVQDAIEKGDRRCIACHASGSADDGPDAVASPHAKTSSEAPLPVGSVWADPLTEWRAAFEADTGGGHNVLTASAVGASAGKSFPLTSFSVKGTPRTWALPPNSGATTWLRAEVFGAAAVATPESISHIRIGCDDCHIMPEDARGPHGSSVRMWIDPAYSQSEYGDPTPFASQWKATGTDRVVCMKCHPMQKDADAGVVPGGHSVHAAHAEYWRHPPAPEDPAFYGAKCIDCHVRVPHAWKRPRLLVRTVETTDGVVPDNEPYVRSDHEGLVGVVLRDFNVPADLKSGSCATGGCYDSHTSSRHPEPTDIPGAEYWP